MKKLLLFTTCLLAYTGLKAQAPGGVSAGLEVWLKADNGMSTTTDNTNITSWQDALGIYNATGVNNPVYRTGEAGNTANFNPSVQFTTGANRHFTMPSGFTDYTEGRSSFSVHNYTSADNWARVFEFGNGSPNNNIFLSRSGTAATYTIGSNVGTTVYTYPSTSNSLVNDRFTLTSVFTDGGAVDTNAASVFLINGLQNASGTVRVPNVIERNNNYIGRSNNAADAYFKGFQSEFINYNRRLTADEALKVNSYMSLKYGITMGDISNPVNYVASNNTVFWTGNATYQNNIAGIVRDDASALFQKQARSVNSGFQPIISLGALAATNQTNTGNITTNRSAMLWGSDAGAASFATAYNFHDLSTRMTRVWKIQETGIVGTVKVYFPAADKPHSLSKMSLLISSSATFDGSATKIEMTPVTVNGVSYYVADVNFTNGQFFTFGGLATAPGGVFANLQFWTKADAGTSTTTDATTNTNWINLVDGIANSAQTAPTFYTSGANFNPKLTFNGSNNFYQWNNSDFGIRGLDNWQVFSVNTRTASSAGAFLMTTNNGTNTFHYNNATGATGKQALFRIGGQLVEGTNNINTGIPVILGVGRVGSECTLYFNNLMDGTVSSTNNFGTPGMFTLARRAGVASYWGGDIHEVIIYANSGMDLTPEEKLQINTYLALKYGITLEASNYLASDGTTQYWTQDATYQNNIAGIVRDDISGLLQKQSKSMITGFQPVISLGSLAATNKENTSTFAADKNAMVWGSDAGAASFATAYNFHDLSSRMTRIWKVQETGIIGTVKVYFPVADKPGSLADFSLLVSNSATIDGSATQIEMTPVTVNGVDYYTADVDFANGQFFTFGGYVTSPGGVLADLELWLKADGGMVKSGNNISVWQDQSLMGYNFNGSSTPQFVESGFNYNPSIFLNGTSQYFVRAAFASGYTAAEIFYLIKSNKTLAQRNGFSYFGTNGANNSHYTDAVGDIYDAFGSTGRKKITPDWDIMSPNIYSAMSKAGAWTAWRNGAQKFTTATNTMGWNTDFFIGWGRADYFSGEIPEVVLYKKELTATEKTRVNSYIALKYGITLEASDYLASDGTTKYWEQDATYQNNIAGVVRDDASGLLQKQSKSVNAEFQPVISLGSLAATNQANTSTISADKNAMVWGSDAGAASFATAYNFHDLNSRMTRIWKVQETGTVGTVKVYFPAASKKEILINLSLLVSNSATFDSSATNIPMTTVTVNGIDYYVAEVDFSNGQFFTFGGKATAPGGVFAHLQLWTKANAGTSTTTDGAANTKWTNLVDGVQNASASAADYKANGANFNPALLFAGDYYAWANGMTFGLEGTNNFQIFTAQTKSTAASTGTLIGGAGGNGFFQYHMRANGIQVLNTYNIDNVVVGNQTLTVGIPAITGASRVGNDFSLYFNHAVDETSTNANSFVTPTYMNIGARGGGNHWSGELQEVVIYSDADMNLTAAERLRVNTYLALKYGITLSATDYLASDGTTKYWDQDAAYQNNIAGIVRDDISGLLQKQSKSMNADFQPVISLGSLAATNQANTSTISADKNAMVWGSDAGAASFATSYNFHNLSSRMTRIWKAQETGAIGTVKVYFPASYKSDIIDDLSLLVSSSATFDGSATKTEMTLVTVDGVDYYTADVDFTNGQFFTFAGTAIAPGGVFANLQFWIKGDGGTSTTTDGAANTNWTNLVDGIANETQNAATYKILGANFNPTLTFNGSSNLYRWTNSIFGLQGTNSFQIFSAQTRPLNVNNHGFLILTGTGPANDTQNGSFQYDNNSGVNGRQGGNGYRSGNIITGTKNINLGVPTINGFGRVENNFTMYLNNTTDNTETNSHSYRVPPTVFTLGFRNGNGSNYWRGDMHEFIIYSNASAAITETQRKQINSYLAIKYGVTMGEIAEAGTKDYVASDGTTIFWNGETASDFHNRVFGIGKDAASGLNQKVARSEIAGANDLQLVVSTQNNYTTANKDAARTISLDNRSFVMIGDDNGTLTAPPAVIDCPLPDDDIVMLDRKFRVQQTSHTDAFWLYVPTGNIPLKSKLRLMIGTGIDGSGNITGSVTTIEGTYASDGFYFNLQLNEDEHYFAILGSESPYCQIYDGDKVTMKIADAWDSPAARTANVTSWYDVGTEGIIEAQQRVSFNGIAEHYPANNPSRGWANYLTLRKRDNTNSPGRITYQVDFRDKATGVNMGLKPSFSIRGINIQNNKRKWVRVVGYDCNGKVVKPKLTYRLATNRKYNIKGSDHYQAKAIGSGGMTWRHTMMDVKFNQPVYRVEIEYSQKKVRNGGGESQLYITNMSLAAPKPLPPTPDNIVIKQNFDSEPVPSCEQTPMTLTFVNNNCDEKTIDYSLNLPSNLEFVDGSIQNDNTSGTVTYADQALTLQNFVIPPGESVMIVNVAHKVSADATYNVQGTFTVVGGVNNPNPYLTDGDDDMEGYQQSKLTFTETEVIPLPEVAITSDRVEGCGLINYTVTLENNSGSPMTGLVFETELDEAGGQIITVDPDNIFSGLLDFVQDDDTGDKLQFSISGMTVPPGTHTMTFQTNATLFAKELFNKVIVYADGDACAASNYKEASYLEKPCITCESGSHILYSGAAWRNAGAGGRSSNQILGANLVASTGAPNALMADISVTYPVSVSEYRGGRFPRLNRGWAQISRRDKINGEPGTVTYKVDLKDEVTGDPISAKPSFSLVGIIKKNKQAERVEVYGLDCNGDVVIPIITKGPGNSRQRRNVISGNVVTGIRANREFHRFSLVNVKFEKEVESVVIDWDVSRAPVRRNINSLFIGNMVFDCPVILEENTDDMHVVAKFQEEELATCEDATLNLNIKNLRCVDREINLSNVLPAGLEYVEDSYAGIDEEAPVYSGNSFTLNALTVPPGESYISVKVRPVDLGTTATYSTLFNYTVTGGENDPNPYESTNGLGIEDGSGNTVNETSILYTASTPLEAPVVTQTVDQCFTASGGTELTYTVTIENPTAQPMTGVKFTDDILAMETYVAGSIDFEDFTNNGTQEFDTDENGDVLSVIVEGMEIAANTTATITYKVTADLTGTEPEDTDTDGTDLWFTKQTLVELEPAGEDDLDCSNYAFAESELNVYKCIVTFCYKDPATGAPQEVKGVAISTFENQLAGWPDDVPNSLLTMESKDKGFVITRLSTIERDLLDPVEGMFIYNTTVNKFQLYKGALNGGWVSVERGCNE